VNILRFLIFLDDEVMDMVDPDIFLYISRLTEKGRSHQHICGITSRGGFFMKHFLHKQTWLSMNENG